jgi:hypothetical protein
MGMIFKVPAILIYVLGGIWGFFLCIGIVYDTLGFIGAVIAFFLLPFMLYLAPWYAGFADGNWLPVMVIYGATVAAAALFIVGGIIDGDK